MQNNNWKASVHAGSATPRMVICSYRLRQQC